MDGRAWWAAVHGIAKSPTRLSDFTFTFHIHALEKDMATHSNVLAWRIPGTGEPGGLPSVRSHRVGHNWSDLAATDDQISSPASPSRISQINCENKIASKKDHKESTSLHTVGDGDDSNHLSQWSTEITSPFSLESLSWPHRNFRDGFGTWVHLSPRLLAFWLEKVFPF